MNQLSVRCIKSAFMFLALGTGLGAAFALDRSVGAALRPLHAQLNLWGWVTLLIYGMAYHMLPRFAGQPLRWSRLATAQSWVAIGGVTLVSIGWLAVYAELWGARVVLVSGGMLQWGAALVFVLLMGDILWRSAKA